MMALRKPSCLTRKYCNSRKDMDSKNSNGILVCQISHGLRVICQITVDCGGDLVVSQINSCLHLFSQETEKLNLFGCEGNHIKQYIF